MKPRQLVLVRRAAQAALQDSAARELRRVALACPSGAAREIVSKVRQEHWQGTAPDRALVKDVRDRGGVCFPGGMTAEEWRNRLPRALHGKPGRCVPADELAQEFFDRGVIVDAYSDTVLDHLGEVYQRARSKPPVPDEGDLKREARRLVVERVMRAAGELVRTAWLEAEAACPRPETAKGA